MLHYTLTRHDYVAFNLYVVDDSSSYRRMLAVLRVVAAVIAALTVPVWWLGTDEVIALDAFLAIAFASVVLTGLVVWAGWPWALRWATWLLSWLLAGTGLAGAIGSHHLEWNEHGFREISPRRATDRSWNKVARIEESPDHLILFLNLFAAVIIPKRAGAGVVELAAFARHRVGVRRPV